MESGRLNLAFSCRATFSRLSAASESGFVIFTVPRYHVRDPACFLEGMLATFVRVCLRLSTSILTEKKNIYVDYCLDYYITTSLCNLL